MNFWQRILAGLALVNQLVPFFLAAAAGVPVRIRAIEFQSGSRYRIAGAGPAVLPSDLPDDLLISVR